MLSPSKTVKSAFAPEVKRLAQYMSAQGYKVTQPRLAVLQAVLALGGSFSVNDLEHYLVQQQLSPGLASIFRTVKMLTELGLLQRIHGLDDCHRYSLSDGHQHHVVCTECGALANFDDCDLRDMVERLEQRTGYQIESHLLELFGRCEKCRQGSSPRSGVRGQALDNIASE